MKHWYILYTKRSYERKVAMQLHKKNILTYCPLIPKDKVFKTKPSKQELLFPSYLFVKIETIDFQKVLQTQGVINFLYWHQQPAKITQVEISLINQFIEEHTDINIEKIEVNPSASINIENYSNSSFLSFKKIPLPSLGYSLIGQSLKTEIKIIVQMPDREPLSSPFH